MVKEVDRHLVRFQDHGGAADGDFADPPGTEATAHHDPFGIVPRLELEKTADDERELLRKVLDRPLHDAGGLQVPFGEQRVELFPADVLARLVAERVVTGFAQRLAPALEDGGEGAFVGAIAKQALLILQLDVVAVDIDRGEAVGAMGGDGRQGRGLIGHEPIPVAGS
jgi:hypothetical protein